MTLPPTHNPSTFTFYAFGRRFATFRAFWLYMYCQYVCSLGIEPTTVALLTQCYYPLSHRNTSHQRGIPLHLVWRLHLNIFDLWNLYLTSKYQKVFIARQFMRYVLYSSSCDAPSASKFSVIIQKCTAQKFGHITILMFLNIAHLLLIKPSFIWSKTQKKMCFLL